MSLSTRHMVITEQILVFLKTAERLVSVVSLTIALVTPKTDDVLEEKRNQTFPICTEQEVAVVGRILDA